MNDAKWFVVCMLGVLAFLGFIIWNAFSPSALQKEYANGKKLDNCITLVNEVITDPNETEERSTFLKNCYEAK